MNLEKLFNESLSEFFDIERENILNGVAERNLCARLAMYMERNCYNHRIEGYYADTEYNRNKNGSVKTILDDNYHVITINCDLILHSRGQNIKRDNLIAIEMKKSARPEKEKESDRIRLRALTKDSYDGVWSYDGITLPEHVCGYVLGYFIEINKDASSYILQKFKKGLLVEEIQNNF